MIDINERQAGEHNDLFDVPREVQPEELIEPVVNQGVPEENSADGEGVNGTWRKEAGRKGAKRIHQLIEAGKRYEEEHGLTSGRQRLRQLIELGKIYEEEHGTRPAKKERKGRRLSRMERDEVVETLLKCLIRMVKPSFRADLERLVAALKDNETVTSQAA